MAALLCAGDLVKSGHGLHYSNFGQFFPEIFSAAKRKRHKKPATGGPSRKFGKDDSCRIKGEIADRCKPVHERRVRSTLEGFDSPPMIMLTYAQEYDPDYLERCGLTKARDLYAYIAVIRDVAAGAGSTKNTGSTKRSFHDSSRRSSGATREQTPQSGRQRNRQAGQGYPRDHVDDVVIPEIDRRDDQPRYQRNQDREEYFLPLFPCVIEAEQDTEQDLFECPEPAPGNQDGAKREGEK
jgi:hypothetical protein